jgi:hypothetical protein
MRPRQTVTLTCRLVSLWFFFHAGTGLLAVLPAFYTARRLTDTIGAAGLAPWHGVYASLVWVSLVSLFPITIEFLFGVIFYRAGVGVTRFLFGEPIEEPPAAEGTA